MNEWFILGLAALLGVAVAVATKGMVNAAPAPAAMMLPAATLSTHYQNQETWEVTWNAQGLPTRIIIHRHATQQ